IHLPSHGTLKTLRLEAPAPELVHRIVEARLRPALQEIGDTSELPPCYPFTAEQIDRIAQTEPTLRDMLQQLRAHFDHVVFGSTEPTEVRSEVKPTNAEFPVRTAETPTRLPAEELPPQVKSFITVETPAGDTAPSAEVSPVSQSDLWERELA